VRRRVFDYAARALLVWMTRLWPSPIGAGGSTGDDSEVAPRGLQGDLALEIWHELCALEAAGNRCRPEVVLAMNLRQRMSIN
jgi:hypothetical protein